MEVYQWDRWKGIHNKGNVNGFNYCCANSIGNNTILPINILGVLDETKLRMVW